MRNTAKARRFGMGKQCRLPLCSTPLVHGVFESPALREHGLQGMPDGNAWVFTRRVRNDMKREHNVRCGAPQPELCGFMISRDSWLAQIEQDHELHLHHQDEESVLASWNGREGVFCHRYGLLTTAVDDSAALGKLDTIARSSSEGSSESASHRCRSRRCISRWRASGLIAVAGLTALALGKIWLDNLLVAELATDLQDLWVKFFARTLFMTGAAAVFGAIALACSCLLPWKGRAPLYAAIALGAALVVFLTC